MCGAANYLIGPLRRCNALNEFGRLPRRIVDGRSAQKDANGARNQIHQRKPKVNVVHQVRQLPRFAYCVEYLNPFICCTIYTYSNMFNSWKQMKNRLVAHENRINGASAVSTESRSSHSDT